MWEQYDVRGCISIDIGHGLDGKKVNLSKMKAMNGATQRINAGWGVRVRETKYFIFFREIRYKQREHNYWIERAGGWRIKIPFCKTYEQTRIANWIVVDLPFVILYLWIVFSQT